MLESMQDSNIYRGAGSSKQFNKRNNAAIRDLNRTYALLTENEKNITENMDIVLRENFFLQNHIQQLEEQVDKLQALVEEQSEESSWDHPRNIFLQNFYTTSGIRNGQDSKKSNLDLTYGVATPWPTAITSKISYETDSGERLLPSGLQLFAKEAKNTERDSNGNLIYKDLGDAKIQNAVDKNKNSFWIRDVSYEEEESVTEVFGELYIKLPTAGMNNPYANALTIHPYPEGSMRIHDIQYKGYGDQWSRIETYPVNRSAEGDSPQVIENCRKLFLTFPRTEITELRIFYSQPYWFESGARRIFSYGFQDIDLEYRLYTEKSCEFVTTIDIEDKESVFKRVSYPEAVPSFATTQNLTNLVEHHLFYDDALETEFDFDTDILTPVSTIYIQTILKKEGDAVPTLSQLRIPYTFSKNG